MKWDSYFLWHCNRPIGLSDTSECIIIWFISTSGFMWPFGSNVHVTGFATTSIVPVRLWSKDINFTDVTFLLLTRYVPNVVRGVHENNVPTTNDRPTDLAFWKNSNGHISATSHPIHFMFGVGFPRSADRMDLLPVVQNPRFGRSPSWKISNDHISGMS